LQNDDCGQNVSSLPQEWQAHSTRRR
jgi:hypothetical protein